MQFVSELSARVRLESLFAEHGATVRAYALRRTDAASADDIVSEVFLVAWRRREDLPEHEPLPWLLACARRLLANQRRSRSRALALRDRLAGEPVALPAPSSDRVLARALSRLGEADREVLMLIAWEELPQAQAAKVLGCSRAAVAMRLSRARRRLAHALAEEGRAPCNPAAPAEARR